MKESLQPLDPQATKVEHRERRWWQRRSTTVPTAPLAIYNFPLLVPIPIEDPPQLGKSACSPTKFARRVPSVRTCLFGTSQRNLLLLALQRALVTLKRPKMRAQE